MRHLFSPRQHRCHVRSGCRRRLRPAVRAAVSPRRIARRAIGKKAGFPIEFIRLTSVDSVAPTMAGTNGAHRAAPRRVAGTREFRYGVESLGNCQWQRYELSRIESTEETDSICVRSCSAGIGHRSHLIPPGLRLCSLGFGIARLCALAISERSNNRFKFILPFRIARYFSQIFGNLHLHSTFSSDRFVSSRFNTLTATLVKYDQPRL